MTPRAIPVQHLLAASFAFGLALSVATRSAGALPIALAVAAAGTAALAPAGRTVLLAAALVLAGWWWGGLRLDAIDHSTLAGRVGSSALVRAEVTGPTRSGTFELRAPVHVTRVGRERVDEPAQLELPVDARLPPQGAIVEAVVGVEAPESAEDGGFDERSYLHRRGIHVVLRAHGYRIVGQRGGLVSIADRLRRSLSSSIAPGLTGERRALVEGVVLGADEGLDESLRDRFRASGLYHLLAVSGQNVAYVVGGVLVLAWLAGLPRVLAHWLALVAIAGYVAAVGWQPSVVRAGVAGALASAAWMASRPRDRWYFLLVGACLLLAWSPYTLLDPGFQLSFAAVGAIFVLVPRLERGLAGYPVPRALATVVAVSAGCALVTAPVSWLHFGAVPVFSVPANALAAPVVAPILGLGLGTAAVGHALPGAAHALAWLNGWLVEYLAGCARLVGAVPFAQVGSPIALGGLLALAALGLAWRFAPRRWRTTVFVVAATVLVSTAAWILWPRGPALEPPRGLRISFLDVGQGDSILLQVAEGAVLVDQGPPEARVASLLGELGVRRVGLLVLTHPQRDHIGGAADVLREVRVDAVLDPMQPAESPYEDAAIDAAEDRGVPVVGARAGQVFRLGRLRLQVLWPDGPGVPGQDPNAHAVVLLATYGSVDALLTADAETDVTGRLRLAPVEILKVAHHGSADEGLPRLLLRLRPRLAVISVGEGNDYGHPTPETLAALRAVSDLRTLRTDLDGTVVVDADGHSFRVRTLG